MILISELPNQILVILEQNYFLKSLGDMNVQILNPFSLDKKLTNTDQHLAFGKSLNRQMTPGEIKSLKESFNNISVTNNYTVTVLVHCFPAHQ